MFTCVIAIRTDYICQRTQSYSQCDVTVCVCAGHSVSFCVREFCIFSLSPKKRPKQIGIVVVACRHCLFSNAKSNCIAKQKNKRNCGIELGTMLYQNRNRPQKNDMCLDMLKRNWFAVCCCCVRCCNSSTGNAPFRFDRLFVYKNDILQLVGLAADPQKRKPKPLCAHVIIAEILQCCVFVLVYHNYSGHAKSVYKSFTWNHVHRPQHTHWHTTELFYAWTNSDLQCVQTLHRKWKNY